MSKIELDKANDKAKAEKAEASADKPAEEVMTPPKAEAIEEKKDDDKVMWQFRYRRYRHVSDVIDADGPISRSTGTKPKFVIKARNWRLPLDLNIPKDKKLHESLLSSPQYGSDFWLLKDSEKGKKDISDRAQTLKKLWDMPIDQLMGMLDDEELDSAGVIPGSQPSKEELIVAIIDTKKFGGN